MRSTLALLAVASASEMDSYIELGALPKSVTAYHDQGLVEQQDQLRFAATVGDGMILAAAPKQAMV